MKVFLMGVLSLLSLSALAQTKELSFCPKPNNKISVGTGHELINRAVQIKKEYASSRIVCNHSEYGNYLFDNTDSKSYEIALNEECDAVEESIRNNLKSSYSFIVDDKTGFVLSIKRDAKTTQCAATQLEL